MTALGISGIIEGFYGPPWSFTDRHRAVEFLAEHGGNTYVYAPKNDPLHRNRWREPYLPEDWADLSELHRRAQSLGVRFWFGVSPLGLRVTDEDDVDLLLAKIRAAEEHGLRDVCLLVDDMPESFASSADADRFPTLAAAHVHIVETVRRSQHERGDDRGLWFVPLHYHGDPDDPYVREIGAAIDPDVAIMWTGPEVCSETISAAHSEAVAASLHRPVLYWDNHPVNDGDMRSDPHLGPLTGRDAALPASSSGILSNVAIEPEASLIAVATFLEFARDPAGYDPDAAWWRALLEVTGDEGDARAVAVLTDLAPRSPLQRGEPEYVSLEPITRFEQIWDTDPASRADAVDELARALADLRATADRLERTLRNERLRRDLAPWSHKLRLQTDAAIEAAAVLAAVLAEPAAASRQGGRRRTVLELIDASRRTFHWVAGQRLEGLARGCLRRADDVTAAAGEVGR